MAGNSNLSNAKAARKDEFYTQLSDIEKELRHYKKHFAGKTVFCNCDDPFESNFFKYFVLNFNRLGLKKIIATCYTGSPIAGQQLSLFDILEGTKEEKENKPYKAVIITVYDKTGDGGVDMFDVAELFKSGENQLTELWGNGDFRSPECLELLEEADIVVTNPPFSLFREYLSLLMDYKKKFIIIGHQNAIKYKEVFPLIKSNQIWLGNGFSGNVAFFESPYEDVAVSSQHKEGLIRVSGVMWFTNLDIKKRHETLILVKRYDPAVNQKYCNYNAINVDKTVDIPCDYSGIMGVPITFMDKYNPEQFEIVGITRPWMDCRTKIFPPQIQHNKDGSTQIVTKLNDDIVFEISSPVTDRVYYEVEGKYYIQGYTRILIRNKHPEPPKEGNT